MRAALGWLVVLALLALGGWWARDYVRRHPQDVPWTTLDLAHPVGRFTPAKLAALGDDSPQCRALLSAAGAGDIPAPPRRGVAGCGYDDGMRLAREGRNAAFAPAGLVTSCPVAAALLLFERHVLQPAAQRHFGQPVAAVDHAGSYSCRRLYGRAEGPFSEHATADAVDIIGVRLADGTRVSVLADWSAGGPKQAFLRDIRNGACRLFATTLSPDYNAAHADHLHLDLARRGQIGWTTCR
ncbi:extensin family protein [Sphingomonas sp.]|uniref:extensin-like domain-containing protein n=1 Tax=Sphingomonas sp. TaxID=28214 RepID=UPI00286E214A|nr:extensin family protein [Sphingomonas sp.]